MWQNSAYMISLARREKEKMVLVLALLSAVFSVASNLVNLYVTPSVLSAVENEVPVSELILIILSFVGLLMLCSAISSYIGTNTLYGRIQVRCALITALNRKAATTSYPNISDEKFKKLCTKASEATCGNSHATEAIWNTLTDLVKNILGFIIYILLLFSLDVWMVLVIIATTLVGYFVNKRLGEYGYRHREEVAEYENKMWYIDGIARDYSAAKDIRIFGIRPWLEELGAKAMEAYTAFHKKANNIYFWGWIADIILTFARNGIAYAYLIRLVLTSGLGASEFLLYFSAVGGFAAWVSGILGNLSTLHRQSLDISTVRECIEYPEPFDFESGEPIAPDNAVKYEIRLVSVSFRYPGSEKYILENINLTLRPGEKLAIVGLNGAGKTTLVKLICGFYDPTEGQVLLNGRDIREYSYLEYMAIFSIVFQDFRLFAFTLGQNVGARVAYDKESVEKCLNKAGFGERLAEMEDGTETYLYKEFSKTGVDISGGEAQKIALARTLYKDAPFIVLDEPTAALDPIAESEIYSSFNDIVGDKTAIYISHRLSSCRFCNDIAVFHEGELVQRGSHEQLCADPGGKYYELWNAQAQYYS